MSLSEFDLVVNLLTSDYGWVTILLFLAYQLFNANPLSDTKLHTIINEFQGQLDRLVERQLMTITVVRALSRTEESIDHERVDSYLAENGKSVSYFIDKSADDGEDPSVQKLDQFQPGD